MNKITKLISLEDILESLRKSNIIKTEKGTCINTQTIKHYDAEMNDMVLDALSFEYKE